jgi:uracil-DNA glycosylase family 4
MGSCDCANNWPGTTHVEGVGPLRPEIMVIGEAPGADEDQSGRPFSGGAGRILDTWLAKTGLQRSAVYIDNVIQHRPPDNDITLANLPAEVPSLFRRILRVRPNLIVLLGNTPLSVFVNGTISDWRGSLLPATIGGRAFKALATYHPAFIMRQKRMWDVVLHDLRKAKHHARTAEEYKEKEVVYITAPTPLDLEKYVEQALERNGPVAVDIETDRESTAIDLIGLCYEEGYAISAPVNQETMRTWFRFFGNVKETVYHNGYAFDVPQLRKLGLPVKAPSHDTLLYSHLLYPHLPRDLGFLNSIYTDYSYYKDQIDVRRGWYNCRDADVTLICLRKQLAELKEARML